MKNVLVVLLVAAFVSACSAPGPREPERYFILDAGSVAEGNPGAGTALFVAPTSTTSFYDTQDIAYSRSPGTRAYYQFNRWTERPARSIHRQLAARLASGSPRDALRLDTHLEEIYHDASAEPGTARIALTAELVDPVRGTVVARRVFARAAPAASYDAPGAVQGFNQALAALMSDVRDWVDAELKRVAPAAGSPIK
jgi:cholesterol transport system auxiliary component